MNRIAVAIAASLVVSAACQTLPAALAADAAWKPQKNVELVIGAQPGGAHDRAGRVLHKLLTDTQAVPVSMTVMNKPGQGQSLAVAYVSAHPADAHYLILLGSSWVTTAIATGSITATQVAGGHVSAGVSSSGSAQAMVSAGKARLIGALAPRRLPQLPDLPTLREQGYDIVAPTWWMVFGPKGLTPAQMAYWKTWSAGCCGTRKRGNSRTATTGR